MGEEWSNTHYIIMHKIITKYLKRRREDSFVPRLIPHPDEKWARGEPGNEARGRDKRTRESKEDRRI